MTGPDNAIGIFTVDARLVVTVWDETLARATGIPAAAATGRPVAEVVPGLEERGLLERFRRVISEGTVEVLVPAFHKHLIRCPPRTASKYYDAMQQRVTIAPLRAGGRIDGAVVTIEDVTDRLERERDAAADLASPDEGARLRAAEALAQADRLEAPTALVGALGDSSWRVRKAAAGGLARRAAPDAVAALLGAMREGHHDFGIVNSALAVLRVLDVDVVAPLAEFLEGGDVNLSVQAALALGEQRDPAAIAPLMRALGHPDPNVQYHAIEALGRQRAAEAVSALAAVAQSGDFFLGYAAIEALRSIGDPSVGARLVPLLADDVLGAAAAEALGDLGGPEAVAPLATALAAGGLPAAPVAAALSSIWDRSRGRDGARERVEGEIRAAVAPAAVPRLAEALQDATPEQQRALARLIALLGGQEADRVLVSLLGRPRLEKLAEDALARRGPAVAGLLVERLGAEDPAERRAAAAALGRAGGPEAVPALEALLLEDSDVACVAAEALARTGDPRALDPLVDLLRRGDPAARHAAVGALAALPHAEVSARVAVLLDDPDPHVREAAVRALRANDGAWVVERVLACCRDADERVRCAAAEQAAGLDDGRVVPELVRMLETDAARARAAAVHALGRMPGAGGGGPVLTALGDPDAWVRYFAARSAAALGLRDGAAALARLAETDPAQHVRIAAMEALGRVGGPEHAPALTSHAASADADVARAAAAALAEIAARRAGGPHDRPDGGEE